MGRIFPAILLLASPLWTEAGVIGNATINCCESKTCKVALQNTTLERSIAFIDVTNTNDSGAGSLRAAVAAAGDHDTVRLEGLAGTTVRLFFDPSSPDDDAIICKYDTATGCYHCTACTSISDDLSCLAIKLTDGGQGDDDGVANGMIVDPLGTGEAPRRRRLIGVIGRRLRLFYTDRLSRATTLSIQTVVFCPTLA
ncbi:hypothetical protein DSCA_21980 [Desulfosarcina alkanivorans]|uniref:Uncharacterized protein n=1 Tax=Desulfosarcina alkanivorans TaxID=571177 RepID=A0A5K7YGV3_9BACT|nr:choice-of-anchor U domain-containing protein [Desulfosarcina alkanivorans]BBO68268.1 hypothetical protein DSCA_21980 [Desulfosarcina alkanivorans]